MQEKISRVDSVTERIKLLQGKIEVSLVIVSVYDSCLSVY